MCDPSKPTCTYQQYAGCPCQNGGICVQLPGLVILNIFFKIEVNYLQIILCKPKVAIWVVVVGMAILAINAIKVSGF
jgi:hypothetical protein